MRLIPIRQLTPPFRAFCRHGRWDLYARTLEETGLSWIMEMRLSRLAAHSQPLCQVMPGGDLTPRLLLLADCAVLDPPLGRIQDHVQVFMGLGDIEAASAAAVLGVMSIWRTGSRLQRLETWIPSIEVLLAERSLSPLARASLAASGAVASLGARADLSATRRFSEMAQVWAARADSPSLRVQAAAVHGLMLLFSGDFPGLDLILQDAATLSEHEDVSQISKAFLEFLTALKALTGDSTDLAGPYGPAAPNNDRALPAVTVKLLAEPLFRNVPSLGGHQSLRDLSEAMRRQDMSTLNRYTCAWVHYLLSRSFQSLGQSETALLHAREAMKWGESSEGPLPGIAAAMSMSQALIDLREYREAAVLLQIWIERWKAGGFAYFASRGTGEMAGLLRRMGRDAQAEEYLRQVPMSADSSAPPRIISRPPDFPERVGERLRAAGSSAPSFDPADQVPVRVTTFGGLRIWIEGREIYDSQWKGKKIKNLLKALIVHGGTKVSRDLLLDLLWPEQDGDHAASNLKVTISRLRRIGRTPGHDTPAWIVMRHGQVSLVNSRCRVDSLDFQKALTRWHADRPTLPGLIRALNLYSNDFLPHDTSEPWISGHRDMLRRLFVGAVSSLAHECLAADRVEEAVPFLRKALLMDPCNERLLHQQMLAHICQGFPARAMELFNRFKTTLETRLNMTPGPVLTTLARDLNSPAHGQTRKWNAVPGANPEG